MLPKDLKKGMCFSIRKTKNAKKFIVDGLVLKITKENGFKYIPAENAGKILVPVTDHNSCNELILPPDNEIYIR
jgi:hypothetical protein